MAARRFGLYVALCFLPLAAALAVVLVHDTKAANALQCARTSDGTDMEIVRCYAVRGLATPDGL